MVEGDRFGAVDVYYPDAGGARAALVVAADARFATVTGEQVVWLDSVEPYQPGQFYRRELPAIQAVLARTAPLALLVVDGYVHLDPQGTPGLGARVHDAIGHPVVGVAKTAFHAATHAVAVTRGAARRPLYVTAAGLSIVEAVRLVADMAGPYRIPDALRRVDALSRGAA